MFGVPIMLGRMEQFPDSLLLAPPLMRQTSFEVRIS